MEYEILLRFLLASLWGGIVGIEREYRSKSAGFRTMTLISIGACFFTVISLGIGNPASPDRIASNIVTGIGFLGAGVIFRGENQINGITTAATIWAVAAVGMGIGAGYYIPAAIACIFILIILALLPYVETRIDRINQTKRYIITVSFSLDIVNGIEQQFRQAHLKYKLTRQIKTNDALTLYWTVHGSAKNHQQLINALLQDPRISRFEY
ncbi:MAG: MgtC/SapB family protein [Chitinophagaceae bacterium]|nr:MgtC/SapB family protein [Chitinophagaceae bacterium]